MLLGLREEGASAPDGGMGAKVATGVTVLNEERGLR